MDIDNLSVKFARVILLVVGQSCTASSYMDTKSTWDQYNLLVLPEIFHIWFDFARLLSIHWIQNNLIMLFLYILQFCSYLPKVYLNYTLKFNLNVWDLIGFNLICILHLCFPEVYDLAYWWFLQIPFCFLIF